MERDSTAVSAPLFVLAHTLTYWVVPSATFRRLGPFAAERKLRLVTLNLRDYPGSTPYAPQELDDIRDPSPKRQERALRARALELGAFLQWLVQYQDIPPIRVGADSGVRSGGISLIAWSAANCQTMALLAHADQLPERTRALLDTHLRSYVLYGAPPPPQFSLRGYRIDRRRPSRAQPGVDWRDGPRGASRKQNHARTLAVAR